MAAATVSRTPLRSVRDLPPSPSMTVLPCGPQSSELLAAPLPFMRFCPVRPGGVYENTGGGCSSARSPPRSVATATAPPPGLLPEPRQARVTGVSSAHHEEVRGIWHFPRAVPVPHDHDLAADAKGHHPFTRSPPCWAVRVPMWGSPAPLIKVEKCRSNLVILYCSNDLNNMLSLGNLCQSCLDPIMIRPLRGLL